MLITVKLYARKLPAVIATRNGIADLADTEELRSKLRDTPTKAVDIADDIIEAAVARQS